MKAQENIRKCPSTGSEMRTGKSAAVVNIFIVREISVEPPRRIIHGLTMMINKYIIPVIQARYFLLLDGESPDGREITGYAIVDAKKRAVAVDDVRNILYAAWPGAAGFYIHSVIKGHKAARMMEASIKRNFPERVASGGRK